MAAFTLGRGLIHVLIKISEIIFDKDRKLFIGRDFLCAIIGRFDLTVFGQRIDEEILIALSVHRSETDGQHKFGAFIGDSNRTQHFSALFGFLFEIHLSDKELHVLLDIAAEGFLGFGRDFITVGFKPSLETVTFLGREDKDIIFSY